VNKDDPHSISDDTSAADEPTAMWDADALKDLGLEEASKAHEEDKATKPLAAPKTAPAARIRPKAVPKKGKAATTAPISIPLLVVLAVALGVAVYFLVSVALG